MNLVLREDDWRREGKGWEMGRKNIKRNCTLSSMYIGVFYGLYRLFDISYQKIRIEKIVMCLLHSYTISCSEEIL